jgi:hypothetical protein
MTISEASKLYETRIPSSGSMRSRSTASLSYGLPDEVEALGIIAAMM